MEKKRGLKAGVQIKMRLIAFKFISNVYVWVKFSHLITGGFESFHEKEFTKDALFYDLRKLECRIDIIYSKNWVCCYL